MIGRLFHLTPILLTMMALAYSSSAMAQSSNAQGKIFENRDDRDVEWVTEDAFRADMKLDNMARCIVATKRKRAAEVLAFVPYGEAPMPLRLRKLMSSNCLAKTVSTKFGYTGSLFRWAMFSAFYYEDYRKAPVAMFHKASKFNFSDEYEFESSSAENKHVALRMVGDCIIRSDPVSAHSYLSHKVGEKEERLALQAIRSLLPLCAKGLDDPSNSSIRGIVGEAAYRLRNTMNLTQTAEAQN